MLRVSFVCLPTHQTELIMKASRVEMIDNIINYIHSTNYQRIGFVQTKRFPVVRRNHRTRVSFQEAINKSHSDKETSNVTSRSQKGNTQNPGVF